MSDEASERPYPGQWRPFRAYCHACGDIGKILARERKGGALYAFGCGCGAGERMRIKLARWSADLEVWFEVWKS